MDVGRPVEDVVPGARGALLATLAQLEVPVTVRALARHAKISPQGALQLVYQLRTSGLVLTRPAGRSLMVSLNRDHLAVEPLLMLVATRARLVTRLSDDLARWSGLAGGWLFGSAARGDGGPGSDIDLLLVGDTSTDTTDWELATGELITHVAAWTGNGVQLVEHTRRSFAQLVKQRNPLITSLRAEAIPLTAVTPSLLRGAA